MNDESFFSKKGQRQMGSFIGQELLYDYMTNHLDEERKKAVQDYLQANKEAQLSVQKIQNGINYADRLAQTQISEALIEKVTLPSKYSEVLMQKIRFEDWPPALKLGIEATIVAFGITVFAIVIPWHKLMDLRFGPKEVILTEVDKEYASKPVAETDTTPKEEVTFPDEGAQVPTTTLALAVANSKVAQTPTTTTSTTTLTTVAIAKNHAQPTPPPTAEKAAAATAAATAPAADEKRQGELFRGQIKVTNVGAITPKIVERVQALGARKAGQVELGWNKNGDSSYFHFTMPSSRYEELLAAFGEYGSLQIQKEKHERVMPEGIMRIIITIDEKK